MPTPVHRHTAMLDNCPLLNVPAVEEKRASIADTPCEDPPNVHTFTFTKRTLCVQSMYFLPFTMKNFVPMILSSLCSTLS